MGTPRNILAALVPALLLTVMLAGSVSAAAEPALDIPESLALTETGAKAAPEKGLFDSGYEYFTVGPQGIYNLTQGFWRNWDEDYWVEWSFGRHMWGYDAETLFFSTDSSVVYYWDGEVWDAWGLSGSVYGGGIVGFDRNDVYTVGRNNTGQSFLYKWLNDGGTTGWQLWSNLGAYQVTELWGLSGDNLFISGFNGAFLQWDGQTVHELSYNEFGRISSIWGTGAGNIYAIGDGTGLLHWDGESLSAVELPTGFPTTQLRRVWGSGPRDVWAVGAGGTIVHFDGTEWTDHSVAEESRQFESVYGSGPTDVWAVGGGGLGYHYDGTAWTIYNEMPSTTVNYLGVWGHYNRSGDEFWDAGFENPAEGGLGLDVRAWAIETYDNQIVAGGDFRNAGPDTANFVATFDGTSWTPLYNNSGPDNAIYDLTVYDGQLAACGRFTTIDGQDINSVAVWDGTQWNELGDGIVDEPGVAYEARRVVEWNGDLVVVGAPQVTGLWDGSTWTQLDGFTGTLWAATVYEGDLYAAGNTSAPGNGVLRLNGSTWEKVGNVAFSGWTYDMNVYDGDLYIGGDFSLPDEGYNYLTRWNGFSFSQVANMPFGFITSLVDYDGELFVGGVYREIDGETIYNGAALVDAEGGWRPMGSGIDSWSWTTTELDGALWISGNFRYAGNKQSFGIARWTEDPLVLDGPPVTVAEPAMPGEDYTLAVSLTGDSGDDPVLAHYRRRDDDPYQVSRLFPTDEKDGVFEGTIPGNYFGELGFQYYVTGGGEETGFVFPEGDPESAQFVPAWTGVTMTNFDFTPPAAQTYAMMGIPFVAGASQGAILTGAMGSYDPSQWRFGRWDPTQSGYLEFPNTPEFAPGIGYWLIQRTPRSIPVNGTSTSTFGGVTISLKPGWNMIATPYAFPILWSDVTRGPNVEDRLVARSGGSYVDVTQMNPWQGYWVNNTALIDQLITIPPTMAPVKSGESIVAEAPEKANDHLWEIVLGAARGDRSDPRNVAAISSQASDGVDREDYHEPPAMPGDVSLCFEVEDGDRVHTLSTDVRAEFVTGQAWDAVLRVEGGGPVELTFAGSEQVPAEYEVALITEAGRIDLRRLDTATVTVGESGEMRLRLAVGDLQFVAEQEHELPRPFALRPNFPNPFNPRTKVGFTLPRSAQVLLEIYDVRGRKVRTLVDEQFEAGLHEIDWLGRDDGGRSVSTGVYFSRMRADGFEQTRKMTLVR